MPGAQTSLRVLVVDDSAFSRRTISRIIDAEPGFQVVGTAGDGEEAIRQVVNLKPDLITLDLEMPRMDGFTFLRWLMRDFPRPVLVVSSRKSDRSVFRALELGAADFVLKPVSKASERLTEIGGDLAAKLHQIAGARVDRIARLAAAPPTARAAPVPSAPPATGRLRAVVIGASTGGPPAVQRVLADLPEPFPAAVLIAQHMPEGFTRMFAERLDRLTGLNVREAAGGDSPAPGVALLAPGGRHLVVTRGRGGVTVELEAPRSRDLYVPSVDRLFVSAAEVFGRDLTAVVLTGMGDDGAAGVGAVRAEGGATIAESEETSVVFGMPREAIRSGAVQRVLPLPRIGSALAHEALRPDPDPVVGPGEKGYHPPSRKNRR